MFSALGSIFSITPRQAEQTDARQDIQRHDPEYERRHKEKKSSDDDNPDQNNAIISVDALREFLETFVKNSAENGDTQPPSSSSETKTNDTAPRHAQPGTAAYAASSYQNAERANEKSTILLETTDAAQGPALDLAAADIRKIYILIEDLKTLNTANIEYLKIERAASFLESLINAVNKAKTTL